MNNQSFFKGFLIVFFALVLIACGDEASDPAVQPAAADVKNMYDTVNNRVNSSCSGDVDNGTNATYIYDSGTLRADVIMTAPWTLPMTVVYTLSNFFSDPYTINGSITALVTAPDYWTNSGVLNATGGEISTLNVDLARNGDPSVMTGTLVVNGYPYDYETAAYK